MNYPRTLLALSLASVLLLSGLRCRRSSTGSASAAPTDNTVSERSLLAAEDRQRRGHPGTGAAVLQLVCQRHRLGHGAL